MNTVFFDVDTQIDFLYPAGGLYVRGAESIVDNVARLNNYAAANAIALISDTDAHTEDDPEFVDWHPHCVAGTVGQTKPASTLIADRVIVSSKAPLVEWPAGAKQMLLQKQTLDAFSNPQLPGFLQRLNAERFVVYGVVTEICVKEVAWGLIKTGNPVQLVTDAVRHLNKEAAEEMFRKFENDGGKLVTTQAILSAA